VTVYRQCTCSVPALNQNLAGLTTEFTAGTLGVHCGCTPQLKIKTAIMSKPHVLGAR